MEILVAARDQASSVLEGIGETGAAAGSWIEDNWEMATAATAAAGAASEGFARSQQGTNATIGRMSSVLGESEDELRGMIDEMSNATFSIHDAAEGMEILSQRGVDTREEMERQLPMWDTFADATGKDMPQAIEKATRGLGAFGIPASEAEDHIDTITFLSERMDVEMDVMGRRLGRVSSEMDDLDLSLEDGAAGIKVFTDRGMSSRDAMNEFRDAVKESDGDMGALLDNLGLTQEEWAGYQEEVAGAEGMTKEFADTNNEQMTVLQRVQQNVENLMGKYGGLAEAAGMLAPALLVVGPALKGTTLAVKGLSTAMAFLAANPIVLIIAAVAALVAGIIYFATQTETGKRIVSAAWEGIQKAISWAWENIISPAFDAMTTGFDAIVAAAEWLKGVWDRVWSGIASIAKGQINAVIGFLNMIPAAYEAVINALGSGINAVPSFTVPDWVPGIGGREFSLPEIPTVSLPRIPTLHSGGEFRAPSGEGLAMLADRETVVSPGGLEAVLDKLDLIAKRLDVPTVVEVDSEQLGRIVRREQKRHAAGNLARDG